MLSRSPCRIWFSFGLIAFATGVLGGFLLDDPRLRYLSHVGWWTVSWIGMALILRSRPRAKAMAVAVGLGLLARMLALSSSPAFSEDMFRYVYEGRLALWAGPSFPFLHPPAEGPNLDVPRALLDESWRRINHPELATIYPPLAQAVFAFSAALGNWLGNGYALGLRAVLVAFDLATWGLLHRRDPVRALWWGLSPLVIWEVAREGHADGLAAFGLAFGALAFVERRPIAGYLGVAWAALAKLVGLVLIPLALRLTRRGAGIVLPFTFALVALPYLFTLSAEDSGLAAYATRWRSGDGVFSFFLLGAETLLGGDWVSIEVFENKYVGVTRHQVARIFAAATFGVLYLAILVAPQRLTHSPPSPSQFPGFGGLVLLLLLLLSPTLHPWYALWLLPFVCLADFPGRSAAIWVAASAVVLHHPGWLELVSGTWRDFPEWRAALHLPAWVLLLRDVFRRLVTGANPV